MRKTSIGAVFALGTFLAFSTACSGGGGDHADEPGETDDPIVLSADASEIAEAYEESLSELLSIAEQVTDPGSARRFADDFETTAERVRQLSERLEGQSVVGAAALAARGQSLAMLGRDLGTELARISTDPALREPFADALRSYGSEP